jgi:hypothetical protein
MPVLIDHLERRLGQMTISWSGEPRKGLPTFNVGGFAGGTFVDTVSYATLGLGKVPLHNPGYDRHFFLEFVTSERGPCDPSNSDFVAVLGFMWSRCVDSREAVLRGGVIALPPGLELGSRFTHLYAALPVYYDDGFMSVVVENGDSVAIVWLVPITAGEARIVAEQGWERFEEALAMHDPDLMDINREVIA